MNGTEPPKKSLKDLIDSLHSPNRKLVLSHLEKHPFLTGKQIAKLLQGKLPLQEPEKKDYDRTIKMLERMAKDRQIKNVGSPHARLENLWSIQKKKSPGITNYEHTIMEGDVYVSCATAGAEWAYKPPEFKKVGLIPDAKCLLAGKQVYWEIDNGTEGEAKIDSKCKRYIQVSRFENPFYVIFDASTEARANTLLGWLAKFERRNQFLVALHQYLKESPLYQQYVSPVDPSEFLFLDEIDV
jgi:hypothetical protein